MKNIRSSGKLTINLVYTLAFFCSAMVDYEVQWQRRILLKSFGLRFSLLELDQSVANHSIDLYAYGYSDSTLLN